MQPDDASTSKAPCASVAAANDTGLADDGQTRVLMVAHGHPDLAKGGGEIAAYNLHAGLAGEPRFHSVFLARHDRDALLHGGTPFAGTGRPDEILFHATMPDWFRFSQPDKARIWRDFREALETCRPSVVHFHHYLFIGLEAIREARAWNPHVAIVLTLHEYFAICHNEGQMIKRPDGALCHESSPAACSECFPAKTSQDFMLRREFIGAHFDLVDRFIAPSEFLKARYVAWGLDANRIEVIENVLGPRARAADAQAARTEVDDSTANRTSLQGSQRARIRFGYFGQINGFKGVDLLLEALALLSSDVRARIRLDINGSGLEQQPLPWRRRVQRLLEGLDDTVALRGAYRQDELCALMGATDWMILPSTWWENSPVVILEANRHGLPVIAADIGGMAEKIAHGETGLHFLARRPEALAERIAQVVADPGLRAQFSQGLLARHAGAADTAFEAHTALYTTLLDRAGSIPASIAA